MVVEACVCVSRGIFSVYQCDTLRYPLVCKCTSSIVNTHSSEDQYKTICVYVFCNIDAFKIHNGDDSARCSLKMNNCKFNCIMSKAKEIHPVRFSVRNNSRRKLLWRSLKLNGQFHMCNTFAMPQNFHPWS